MWTNGKWWYVYWSRKITSYLIFFFIFHYTFARQLGSKNLKEEKKQSSRSSSLIEEFDFWTFLSHQFSCGLVYFSSRRPLRVISYELHLRSATSTVTWVILGFTDENKQLVRYLRRPIREQYNHTETLYVDGTR